MMNASLSKAPATLTKLPVDGAGIQAGLQRSTCSSFKCNDDCNMEERITLSSSYKPETDNTLFTKSGGKSDWYSDHRQAIIMAAKCPPAL
jgi:hypothetical protein